MSEYITNKPLTASDLGMSLDKLLEAVNQLNEDMYKITKIFLGHPLDLIKLDMSEIPCNCYFVCHYGIDIGKLYKVEDGEMKRELYEFIQKHPDRAFRGRK